MEGQPSRQLDFFRELATEMMNHEEAQQPTKIDFDYIVVGAGPAGCALASRLAEDPEVAVLLIEAGEDSRSNAEDSDEINSLTSSVIMETTPQHGFNGRKIHLLHGRVIGGSTKQSDTLAIRGLHSDFDSWNISGWDGESMFASMKRAESFRSDEHHQLDGSAHGKVGPIRVEPQTLAPISHRVMESYKTSGLGYSEDMFSTGLVPTGCGLATLAAFRGQRASASHYLSRHGLRDSGDYGSLLISARDNLHVWIQTTVTRVSFSPASKFLSNDPNQPATLPHARGVFVMSPDETVTRAVARKEVILSAGTYHTPLLLQRSGVGHPEQIPPSITQVTSSPGVGKNLQDHLICSLWYKIKAPPSAEAEHDMFLQKALWHPFTVDEDPEEQWEKMSIGGMVFSPFGAYAYANLNDRLHDLPEKARGAAPHVQLFNNADGREPTGESNPFDDRSHVFAITVMLLHPQSRGSIVLPKDASFDDEAQVDHAYLSDAENIDVNVLAEGCEYADEILRTGGGTKDIIQGVWPANDPREEFKTIDDWIEWVRNNATTGYHPVGTCKMGKKEDASAVVDEKLRVKGVTGLRVADCSIVPDIHSGHTQMVAYGIGERAAELIKGEV